MRLRMTLAPLEAETDSTKNKITETDTAETDKTKITETNTTETDSYYPYYDPCDSVDSRM